MAASSGWIWVFCLILTWLLNRARIPRMFLDNLPQGTQDWNWVRQTKAIETDIPSDSVRVYRFNISFVLTYQC